MGFRTWQDFSKFSASVKRKRRFLHSESVEAFLNAVVETSTERESFLRSGTPLWRAQLGNCNEYITDDEGRNRVVEAPFSQKRMKPPIDSPQQEGRINPVGLSCLYLAVSKQTAISEMRPWKGARVSLARFKTCRKLRIVNCTKHEGGDAGRWGIWMSWTWDRLENMESMTEEEVANFVWADIDASFSLPVGSEDDKTSYIPTQIIAELFRSIGFDGLAYRSATSKEGDNVALFDLTDAETKSCHLFKVSSIEYETEEIPNPYFIQGGTQVTSVVTDVRPAGAKKEPQ